MPIDDYDLAIASNSANGLQLFVVGAHSKQVYTGELVLENRIAVIADRGVAQWRFLGGPSDTLQLAAGKNIDGSLELFALKADGRVWHIKQNAENWGEWSDIGAVDWKQVIIGTSADGRLDAFALVDGGQAVQVAQQSPNGPWGASTFFNQTGWRDLAVGRNADGRLELFAIGADKSGYHMWEIAPGSGWSDWAALGGTSWDELTVISNPDGRLELFILAGGDAYHMWQQSSTTDPCQAFIDALKAAQKRLQMDLDNPNHTGDQIKADRVAITTAQDNLEQCRASAQSSIWSGAASLGAHDLKQIAVARNADGRLELFGLGGDNSIYHIWMSAPNNGWVQEWDNLGVSASQFCVGVDRTGSLVVVSSRDGNGHVVGQTSPNSGWANFNWLPDPEPKPEVTLSVDKVKIKKGEAIVLTWSSSWASTLDLEPGVGSVSVPGGSYRLTPQTSGTVTYTITAASRGGTASASVQVDVAGDEVITVYLTIQPAETYVPYVGTIYPISGGVMKSIKNANSSLAPNGGMYLVKAGHGSSECDDPNAVIALAPNQSTSDMVSLFGTTDMSNGVRIVACSAGKTDNLPMMVDVTYSRP